MKFDLDHLRIFYEVVKAGSFTKAAENLHISQPSVSRTIGLLEDRLELKLFERGPRGIKITPDGERLYEHSERFVEDTRVLISLLTEKSNEVAGDLRIVTTPVIATTWLAKHLPPFLEKHPHLNIEIVGKVDALELENAEVIIRSFIPHHPHLVQRHIKTFHYKLWADPKYIEKYGMPEKAEDLDKHKILAYGANFISPYANNNWILELGSKPGFNRRPYLKINFLEGLVNFANEGLGIIEMPEEYLQFKKVNLIEVLPQIKGPIVDIFYIYPEKKKASKKITALGDYLESIN